MEGPVVGEVEPVETAIRAVEDTQADQRGFYLQHRAGPTVDQHHVTLHPGHAVMHVQRIGHLAIGIKAAVLQDQREIVFAMAAGQGQRRFLVIRHTQHARHSRPDMAPVFSC